MTSPGAAPSVAASAGPATAAPSGYRRSWAELGRHLGLVLLVLTTLLVATGGLLRLAGAPAPGEDAFAATGALGAAYAAWSVIDSLRHRRIGVDVIALLALLGALVVGERLAAAVIGVMLASGRALEGWAAGRARRDLKLLLSRAPRLAQRYDEDGTLDTVDVDVVVPGDRLLVASGAVVPVDGVLLGDGVFDESALTGEALPVERVSGDPVRSGVVNAGGPVDFRATTTSAESTYAGIVRLVATAEADEAPFVRLADTYAVWFLLLTLGAAGAAWALGGAPRAVAVLVVATPCPLILAAPIALVSGLSRAARLGVVVKGGGVLERMAACSTVLIDKTGTLTSGNPVVSAVVGAEGRDPEEILRLAGSLDQVSAHVLAHAVVRAAREHGAELELPEAVEEVAGHGIRGRVGGHDVALGKAAWIGMSGNPAWAKTARRRARLDGSLTVFVAVDGEPAGVLVLDDPIRNDAARTVRALRRAGVGRVVMVSGDRTEVADTVGAVIGVDEVLAERSPADKLDVVRAEHIRAPTIMVGDGINDAPALALADVGVAMATRGATVSSEAADVVLTVDRLDRLGSALVLARRSRAIAVQSVVTGMALSLGAMAVAGAGYLPAVWGALLQEAIDVAVIVNALRSLRPAPAELHLAGADDALARRFEAEHRAIRLVIDRLRRAGDMLDDGDMDAALDEVHDLHGVLVDEVLPHEEAEQEVLYPALERLLGGHDPTGPMTRAHVEIAHQIRRLGQLLDDIGAGPPDREDVAELRRLLYGLHAVLRLHTAQEDESYLSLAEHGPAGASPASEMVLGHAR